jgi:L-amino acid N-acyltransferase YncA
MQNILITAYKPENAPELLRLLLELHDPYFQKTASEEIRGFNEEHEIAKSYGDYVADINAGDPNVWKTFLAVTSDDKIIGFIIGRIKKDEALIRITVGVVEDWFIEEKFRGKKIGLKLYQSLESWFKEKGCDHVVSETWAGNELSIHAHKQMGFFVSGIIFSKKL